MQVLFGKYGFSVCQDQFQAALNLSFTGSLGQHPGICCLFTENKQTKTWQKSQQGFGTSKCHGVMGKQAQRRLTVFKHSIYTAFNVFIVLRQSRGQGKTFSVIPGFEVSSCQLQFWDWIRSVLLFPHPSVWFLHHSQYLQMVENTDVRFKVSTCKQAALPVTEQEKDNKLLIKGLILKFALILLLLTKSEL